jgi:hypothetical protein
VLKFGMSSRHLHPVSCRLPRSERAAVVTLAASRGMSVSALLKAALRYYLGSPISVDPGVYQPPSPEPPPLHAMVILPRRQSPRPLSSPKPENRQERGALGRDSPDRIR